MAAVHSIIKVLMVTVAGAGVLCLGLSPAHAGFDWTPPATTADAVAPEQAVPPTAAAADPNLLTPEPDAAAPVTPVEGAALKAEDLVVPAPAAEEPLAVAPIAASAEAESVPAGMKTISSREQKMDAPAGPGPRRVREEIQWNAGDAKPVKAEAESVPAAATEEHVAPILSTTSVQGFAKDISLALALSQVVPPNYAYKFEDGVNPGQKVSWQGGKPWPQVLSDMLTASNLQVVIIGNVVTVQPAPGVAASIAPETAPVSAEETKAEAPAPAAPASEVKVARLSQTEEAADLPVPMRSASLSDTPEAQAIEASEKEAVAADEPLPVTPATSVARSKDVPVVDIQTSRRWEASPGKTLRETLEGWSTIAGAEVEWMSPYDYPVDHAFVYEGKFDVAVDSLLSLYSREQQRPRGKLYPNLPTGPSVLMVN